MNSIQRRLSFLSIPAADALLDLLVKALRLVRVFVKTHVSEVEPLAADSLPCSGEDS